MEDSPIVRGRQRPKTTIGKTMKRYVEVNSLVLEFKRHFALFYTCRQPLQMGKDLVVVIEHSTAFVIGLSEFLSDGTF